jgi:hypothetical protein
LEYSYWYSSSQNFFEKVNERWIQDLVNSAQDLRNCLPYEQHPPVDATVGRLQAKWKVEYTDEMTVVFNNEGNVYINADVYTV